MKTLSVEDPVWKKLHQLRLDWNKKTLNDVLKELLEGIKNE